MLWLALASAFLLSACATITPTIEARMAPLPIRERLPLRAALLVDEDEREKAYVLSVSGHPEAEVRLQPGVALQDSLHLSLIPAFERVTVVRTRPSPDAHDVILVPRVTGASMEGSVWQGINPGAKFVINGSLSVLDRPGEVLLTVTGAGEGRAANLQEAALSSGVSQAMGALVRKLGEQLFLSPHLEQYAARIGRKVVAGGGSPALEVVIRRRQRISE